MDQLHRAVDLFDEVDAVAIAQPPEGHLHDRESHLGEVEQLLVAMDAQPQVDLRFAAWLVVGSAAGAYLGARVMMRIPDRPLRMVFSVAMVAVGLKEVVAP